MRSEAGRRILRSSGLLRSRPGAWRSDDHALLRHYLADLPMALIMTWDRLARELGRLTGATQQMRGGAVTLN